MVRQSLILGRYKPLAKAGAGGFGTVQVAWDTRIQRKVAIKCIQLSEADLRRASLPGADMGGSVAVGVGAGGGAGESGGVAADAGAANAAGVAGEADAAGVAGEADAAGVAGGAPVAAGAGESGGVAADAGAADSVAADTPPWEDLPDEIADEAFANASDNSVYKTPDNAFGNIDETWDDSDSLDDWVSPFRRPNVGSAAAAPGAADAAARLARYAPAAQSSSAAASSASAAAATRTPAAAASPASAAPAAATRTPSAAASPASAAAASPAAAAHPMPDDPVSLTHDDTPLVHTLARIPGLDEARTAAMLTDSNIVAVYDFEIQDSTAYLIMEYVEGMTLTELLRNHDDELTLDIVATVFDSVAHALEVAHESNVLHLDIKPDNILINEKGQVKVTDFGLATLADAAGFGTTGGGTIGYMPLEQMRRESLDARCDEWALASVTYEMLAGENPFFAPDLTHAQEVIEDAELVIPSLCWDELGEDADDVLFIALDPDRDERYATVEEFADEFEPLLGDARAGKHQLAAIVQGPEEEEPVEEEPEPRLPLREYITPRMLRVASHACGALGSALLAFWSLSLIPVASGLANPLFWGIGALVALAGGLRPHLGALLGFVALSAACIAQNCPAGGCILLAATIAWWWLLGRFGDSLANTALAVPLGGVVGLGSFAPLAAGLSLRTLPAMGTAAFQVLVAFVLASFGSGSLLGWNGFINWEYAISHTAGMMPADAMISMISQPGTWVIAISWIAAAGLCALCCARPTRAFAITGTVLAVAVLLLGIIGAAGCAAAWKTMMPDAISLVGVIASGIIAVVICTLFPDPQPEFDSESDFDEEDFD